MYYAPLPLTDVHNNDIGLVNLGRFALFNNYKLTTSSGKHLEEISYADIVCLMYTLITSARDTDDLSICFDRSRHKRQRELTNNRTQKGKFLLRIFLGDVFSFAEHQDKSTFGLGYNLTLTRYTDSVVLNKDSAINNAKIEIFTIEWYVPQYTPSLEQHIIIMNQIIKKMATELQPPERSVLMKEVNTQSFRTFELGTEEGINVPIWNLVFFQQSDGQHDQNLNNDIFCRLPVTSAQCIIGTERHPNSAVLLKYDDGDYSQSKGQIKEAFRALTKNDKLQPHMSEHDFRSSKDGSDIGYNIHVFDIRYQKNFDTNQSVKVEYKFSENIPPGISGYALVLTIILVSRSSDGNRMFDLVYF